MTSTAPTPGTAGTARTTWRGSGPSSACGRPACRSGRSGVTPSSCGSATATRPSGSRCSGSTGPPCWPGSPRSSATSRSSITRSPSTRRSSMNRRKLGNQGLEVSAEGLGCMGMTWAYGAGDEASGRATIDRALELGVTFLDTAEVYGPHTNEELVGRAIAGRRDRFEIATKFGFAIDPDRPSDRTADGTPENVRRACEGSLRRLGVDTIDLFYQHRVDPDVPIEETVGAMGELVREGQVRYLGLSEAAPETIRRAHATHPITALQSEYSLWTRDPEDDVLATLRELGIGFVAYSPLGRGFLTGQIRSMDDLSEDDWRRSNP